MRGLYALQRPLNTPTAHSGQKRIHHSIDVSKKNPADPCLSVLPRMRQKAVEFTARFVTISIKSIAYLIATEDVLIASSRLIGADRLESWVPVRLVTAFILYFHPSVIIDGETAYDVRMWDAQVFYGVMICALLLTMTRTFSTRRKKSSFHAPED